jgi:DNA-binding beta-propeller fold protein YncE
VLRAVILAAALLLVLVPAASSAPAGGTAVAFVSVEDDDRLVAVDLTSGRILARIPVPDGPRNVAESGARWILVTSPPAGAVTLVDGFSQEVVKVFRGFGYPHDVEVEGARAYVTDETRGQLVVISLPAQRILARIPVGPRPHDVAVSDVALVTHGSSHPDLTMVDVNLGRKRGIRRLAVGGPAHDISKQPDSANVYVTYWNRGSVGAVDWGRGRLLWRARIGTLVRHVQFDYFHGRRLWATDHTSGRSYLISARNGRVLRTLTGCPGAQHLAMGGTAWVAVACHEAGALAIHDARTWRRKLVRVGAGAHGVAVAVLP